MLHDRIPLTHRIGTRILAALVGVSLTAVCATGVTNVLVHGRLLRRNISDRNLQIAIRACDEIGLYLEDAAAEARAVGEMLGPFEDPWLREVLLGNLLAGLDKFERMRLVDGQGRVLADSSLDRRDRMDLDPRLVATVRVGLDYFSPVRLSAQNLPSMTVAVPAVDFRGRRRTLVAELDLRRIWQVMDEISASGSGQALLFSADNILIAHPDKAQVLSASRPYDLAPLAQAGRQRAAGVQSAADGRRFLVAWTQLPVTGWKVVVQQPLEEAYIPLQGLAVRTSLTLAGVLALALLASLWIVGRLSRPLNLLLEGTERIGRGELDYRIEVRSRDEIGKLSVSFNTMVEDLRRWSQKLSESEEKYRLLTEGVNDVIFSVGRDGRFLFVNRRIEEIVPWPGGELVGRDWRRAVTPRSAEQVVRLLRSGHSRLLAGGLEVEVELAGEARRQVVMEVRVVAVFGKGRSLQFYGVARDITQRKQAERKLLAYQRELRSLASQLTLAEARERKRIAADLHDRIGQGLSLARIKLATLRTELAGGGKDREIGEIVALVEQTIGDARTLIFELSSPLLYEVGLEAALEQLVEQFRNQHGVPVTLKAAAAPASLGTDVSVLLYQAVRELLLNAVKHARPESIKVRMEQGEGALRISVEDDGRGFDTGEVPLTVGRDGGFGLFSIRERLGHVNGKLELRSAPRRGTRATLVVPLSPEGASHSGGAA